MPTEGSGFERGAASNTKEPCSNPVTDNFILHLFTLLR